MPLISTEVLADLLRQQAIEILLLADQEREFFVAGVLEQLADRLEAMR